MRQMVWLRVGVGVLGLTAVFLLLLIALGVFDPQPVGEQSWTAEAYTMSVPPQAKELVWLPESLPSGKFTVRATVSRQSGELDSGAGVALGDGCTAVVIAISPLGYTTIHQTPPTAPTAAHCSLPTAHRSLLTPLPWQPWPHIHPGDAANEIWVDVADGQMQVRLNRELLWAGDAPIQPTRVGWYGESFGDTAVFHFSSPTFWHTAPVWP
ncbi:MAG: hypothetical protein KJ069_01930 [Anaerolineae bacterium]|nr:hypothetical protein [Anaerolineae bacterium]